jgi:hypothetical protein
MQDKKGELLNFCDKLHRRPPTRRDAAVATFARVRDASLQSERVAESGTRTVIAAREP